MSETAQKRIPVKRWIILFLIGLGGYLAFGVGGILKPVSPAVVLPGEPVWHGVNILPALPFLGILAPLPLTNTLLATFVADIVLLVIALGVWRFTARGNLVPQGFYNFVELLIEFLWNTTESTAGRWAKRMFPIMATIFLLVLTANLIKLIPGFESIGYLEEAHGSIPGYAVRPLIGETVSTIDGSAPMEEGGYTVVPFLRGSATDLNFTFALALIAVFMIQVFGIWALRGSYFTKFFNLRTLFTVPFFGAIDFGVGLLELVSEFSKILSFGFRLFGNILAGVLLVSILGALTVVVLPAGLYIFEVLVAAIQAYIFAMLSLVFMSQATVGHHGDEHTEAH
ncbi:MAG: F0F1 ATP synthase subunit A [Chloroflexota bacterium]